MLYTVEMTDTHTTLQADRATWEQLVQRIGRDRLADTIRAALRASTVPGAVRVTLPAESARRVLAMAEGV